jgi:tryptophan synthase alpha chain
MESSSATTSSESFQQVFDRLRAHQRAALVPYLTAGFPDRSESLAALRAADQRADIIEVGVPFSDPVADGPTIQRSSHRALAGGMTLPGALALVREAGLASPVVLFTYLNPVLAYGPDRFLADARDAGIRGLLLTDLPVDGDPALEAAVAASPIDLIRLVAPTTTPARLDRIAATARGFVYLIGRLGVTGARRDLASDLASQVARVRARVPVPVAVGFGIATAEQAHAVAQLADAVVVGSAVVERLDTDGVEGMSRLLSSFHDAMERAT